jgi:hypothetical protein
MTPLCENFTWAKNSDCVKVMMLNATLNFRSQ